MHLNQQKTGVLLSLSHSHTISDLHLTNKWQKVILKSFAMDVIDISSTEPARLPVPACAVVLGYCPTLQHRILSTIFILKKYRDTWYIAILVLLN